MDRAVLPNPSARAEWLFAGIITEPCTTGDMSQPMTGGPGVHDLDFDGSDIETALPDDDDDVVSSKSFPQESPCAAHRLFFKGSEDGVSAMVQRRPLFRE